MKRVLGHKNIKNTLVYTHLIDFREDERVSKVARNADEACELVEAGFDFVCSTPDNLMVCSGNENSGASAMVRGVGIKH